MWLASTQAWTFIKKNGRKERKLGPCPDWASGSCGTREVVVQQRRRRSMDARDLLRSALAQTGEAQRALFARLSSALAGDPQLILVRPLRLRLHLHAVGQLTPPCARLCTRRSRHSLPRGASLSPSSGLPQSSSSHSAPSSSVQSVSTSFQQHPVARLSQSYLNSRAPESRSHQTTARFVGPPARESRHRVLCERLPAPL